MSAIHGAQFLQEQEYMIGFFAKVRNISSVFLGLKARIMSSLTWATFIHQKGESVSFHPVVVAGVLSCG